MTSQRIASFVVALLLAAGCRSQPAKPAPPKKAPDAGHAKTAARDAGNDAPKIVHDKGPMPKPDAVIATAGKLRVTMADFARAAQISLLFAPSGQTKMPPIRLALPFVQLTMTRALLTQKLVDQELKRRDIHFDQKALDAWIRSDKRMKRFAKLLDQPKALDAALATYGLKREDLYEVARKELGDKALADALIDEVEDDEIWKAYQAEKTTRTLAIASAHDVPTPDEIEHWMHNHVKAVDEYYQKNPKKMRLPNRVKVNLVQPKPGEKVDDATLKKAEKELARGVQPKTVAKKYGLVAKYDVELVRGENPRAFGQHPGQTGWVAKGARGAMAWKVTGFITGRLPELTFGLRRQIAAQLMRSEGLAPGVKAKLIKARKLMIKAHLSADDAKGIEELKRKVEAIDGLTFEVDTIAKNGHGAIGKFGLAEEVFDAAFKAKKGTVSKPILSRERGFVFDVLDAATASHKQFEATIEQNRKAYKDAKRPHAVQLWAQKKLKDLDANIDVEPLRIKYGVAKKAK